MSVLHALQTLYHDPDSAAKSKANIALQDFQKTTDAWQTANTLLLAQELPLESRLFAAQTFRSKITFDLEQLPQDSYPGLRDMLLHALAMYADGPRVIQTQLSLSLAALAIQCDENVWPNVVPDMISRFGGSPGTVGVLLEFLSVLPDEVCSNHRIPIDNVTFHKRIPKLLTMHANLVLNTLAMYIQAEGVTPSIQEAVFSCLGAWLRAGEISASQLAETPLFAFSFEALNSELLFDVAVDVICDLINETQEVEDNHDVIQQIVPRIQALRPKITEACEDDDKMRGLCRIFVQTGETYTSLMVPHSAEMLPIAQSILDCAAFHDLDIVQITFRFWYLLATVVHKSGSPPWIALYEQLFAIIIRHLRFPMDDEELTGQERDDFRSFRHYMGDTLKDCSYVLGPEACLMRSLQMIEEEMASPQTACWQHIEAPLFSMRSMGGQVDIHDDQVVPRIFDVIPQLPPHPRLRYAGLLVISRYTEWLDMHPERIPSTLTYITTGFDADRDISAAAAQAMNYLCQDCRKHLVPFLPQLLDFFATVRERLDVDDSLAVVEAIAHVISASSPAAALESLAAFTRPLLERVHDVSVMQNAVKPDLMRAADSMEQLAKVLQVVAVTFASSLGPECAETCASAYHILDTLLAAHGHVFFISERTSALIRRALVFFGDKAIPTLGPLLERFVACFEATGYSGYVWIVGKSIDQFAGHADPPLRALLSSAFERVSAKVLQLLSTTPIGEQTDVLDDYMHTCIVTMRTVPYMLLLSPVFPHAFNVAVLSLGSVSQSVIGVTLDALRDILVFEPERTLDAETARACSASISAAVAAHGAALTTSLIAGLMTHFSPDHMQLVFAVYRALATSWPDEMSVWTNAAVEQLPGHAIAPSERTRFLTSIQEQLRTRSVSHVSTSLLILFNASRRLRERARLDDRS
ncbi:Nuclear import receptor [Malassezia cuniculi]|uniref:Nuclear import receptor n=1 Tax=Malassezia cuniculi TaxID=948313 RepID=A0AAF0EW43_9BASI|nr:Nuclear import receptor [Malassezia cuniculi]